MKIKLRRPFSYQDTPQTVVKLQPGEHTVDERVANMAVRWGGAELIKAKKKTKKKVQKKAPENKLAKVAANKAGVGRKTKRRRSPRAKPKP